MPPNLSTPASGSQAPGYGQALKCQKLSLLAAGHTQHSKDKKKAIKV